MNGDMPEELSIALADLYDDHQVATFFRVRRAARHGVDEELATCFYVGHRAAAKRDYLRAGELLLAEVAKLHQLHAGAEGD